MQDNWRSQPPSDATNSGPVPPVAEAHELKVEKTLDAEKHRWMVWKTSALDCHVSLFCRQVLAEEEATPGACRAGGSTFCPVVIAVCGECYGAGIAKYGKRSSTDATGVPSDGSCTTTA